MAREEERNRGERERERENEREEKNEKERKKERCSVQGPVLRGSGAGLPCGFNGFGLQ